MPLKDIETGEVECPGCGYHYPPEKVNGICDKCKAAETAKENCEAWDEEHSKGEWDAERDEDRDVD
jgi:hypothetical protein